MTTLAPCPFCGSLLVDSTCWTNDAGTETRCFVRCPHCDIVGPPRNSPEEALAAWNTRTGEARLRTIERAARAYWDEWNDGTNSTMCHDAREVLWEALKE